MNPVTQETKDYTYCKKVILKNFNMSEQEFDKDQHEVESLQNLSNITKGTRNAISMSYEDGKGLQSDDSEEDERELADKSVNDQDSHYISKEFGERIDQLAENFEQPEVTENGQETEEETREVPNPDRIINTQKYLELDKIPLGDLMDHLDKYCVVQTGKDQNGNPVYQLMKDLSLIIVNNEEEQSSEPESEQEAVEEKAEQKDATEEQDNTEEQEEDQHMPIQNEPDYEDNPEPELGAQPPQKIDLTPYLFRGQMINPLFLDPSSESDQNVEIKVETDTLEHRLLAPITDPDKSDKEKNTEGTKSGTTEDEADKIIKIPNLSKIRVDKNDKDEDIQCEYCLEFYQEDGNQIVLCDLCNGAIHQLCYERDLSPQIPEGDWHCERCKFLMLRNSDCKEENNKEIDCSLCEDSHGILVKTDCLSWVHPSCVKWMPFFSFMKDPEDPFYTVECDEEIGKLRDRKCFYCRKKSSGTIRCAFRSCYHHFHISCAIKNKCILEDSKMLEITIDEYSPIFCKNHHEKGIESVKERGLKGIKRSSNKEGKKGEKKSSINIKAEEKTKNKLKKRDQKAKIKRKKQELPPPSKPKRKPIRPSRLPKRPSHLRRINPINYKDSSSTSMTSLQKSHHLKTSLHPKPHSKKSAKKLPKPLPCAVKLEKDGNRNGRREVEIEEESVVEVEEI
ncbi:unnamed protein product [Moneuplotes crassus]|uniref:Uncharacterized protein n=1 Tax=Euplotes crassus TaxID=5936 RepID=A0AAD1U5P0_EUPCR|nr:unnamed protein product [Moneuplotes crassus]